MTQHNQTFEYFATRGIHRNLKTSREMLGPENYSGFVRLTSKSSANKIFTDLLEWCFRIKTIVF
jgi:hypothetical protein